MGANPAENHPISFKWVLRAKDRGATLIHVDPRFTKTSAKCHIYAPLRSGTDIAFLGGMIRYILDNDLYFHEYVKEYTNAGFVVGDAFSFEDGLFSGYNPDKQKYDRSKWAFAMDENGVPVRDPSLQHPRCVFNLLRKHYDRYTLDTVSSVCGTAKEDLKKVYDAVGATGKPDKAATSMYAMGWTQKSVGVQNIRAMAIIQLLLGNIGVAGGGVNALLGESNVQGSTDQALLSHIWPGYLDIPMSTMPTFEDYKTMTTAKSYDVKSVNWLSNKPKYAASLLKAFYPDEDLENAYAMMPKLDAHRPMGDYFWLGIFDRMHKGDFKGVFAWGMNPACSGANAQKNREAFGKLDWLVNVNLFDNETGSFWKGPGMDPASIKTEVFFLPCADAVEREGSILNSGRWQQWRYKGPNSHGQKRDGDIMLLLAKELRALYQAEGGAFPDPVLKLNIEAWDEGNAYSADKVARLMNGYFLKDTVVGDKSFKKGQQVPGFPFLTTDGSTASGCWLICGSYTDEGNHMKRRSKEQTPEQANIGLYPNWAYAWPLNRRILYNRAGVDKNGVPFNPAKAVIQWKDGKWVGDVPDGGAAPGAVHPFIMQHHGLGALYGPGRADGPFPEHYEPFESPIAKHPFSNQSTNPAAIPFKGETFAVDDPEFPYICSTYRVTEHWQTGVMTRRTAWLVEMEPQMFCEMDPKLAAALSVNNGDIVELSSKRGKVDAVAMVTERLQPVTVLGKEVHMVGIPWHYGWVVPEDGGDSANLITPSIAEPNAGTPETKAFMVNVKKKAKG